jgi:hypothetical protein
MSAATLDVEIQHTGCGVKSHKMWSYSTPDVEQQQFMHDCTAVHVCGDDEGVDGIIDTDGQAGYMQRTAVERERERFITTDIAVTDTWTTGPTVKAKIHRIQ